MPIELISRVSKLPFRWPSKPLEGVALELRKDQICSVFDLDHNLLLTESQEPLSRLAQLGTRGQGRLRTPWGVTEPFDFESKRIPRNSNTSQLILPWEGEWHRLQIPMAWMDQLRAHNLQEIHSRPFAFDPFFQGTAYSTRSEERQGQKLDTGKSQQLGAEFRWWHGPFNFEIYLWSLEPLDFSIEMEGIMIRLRGDHPSQVFKTRNFLRPGEEWVDLYRSSWKSKPQWPDSWWSRVSKILQAQASGGILDRINIEFFKRGLIK